MHVFLLTLLNSGLGLAVGAEVGLCSSNRELSGLRFLSLLRAEDSPLSERQVCDDGNRCKASKLL